MELGSVTLKINNQHTLEFELELRRRASESLESGCFRARVTVKFKFASALLAESFQHASVRRCFDDRETP